MKLLSAVKERAPTFSHGGAIASSEFRRQAVDASLHEPESFLSNPHREGRRMRAAAIIFAVLVGVVVTAVSMSELYDKCGPSCWQGLLQAQRERF
jgi:hypothetical protein